MKLLWLGERGLTLELPEAEPEDVLGLAAALERRAFPWVEELLPAMRSVTLYFDPAATEPELCLDELREIAVSASKRRGSGRSWTIPVCFDEDFSPDLAEMAAAKGLSPEDFIGHFLAGKVTVRMLGFLPGFAYLGDLPPICRTPRRATPRPKVPAGSLAIAGSHCAIYPWDSPGGWNLIGRSPVKLFDLANDEHPALFEAGDEIGWERIGRSQFDQWPQE